MTPPTKKKAPGANPTPQFPAAKPKIVDGHTIPLSTKHKLILKRAERFVSDAIDTLGEIENNVARGELRFFAVNTALLNRQFCGCRRLCRAVAAVALSAKREEAR